MPQPGFAPIGIRAGISYLLGVALGALLVGCGSPATSSSAATLDQSAAPAAPAGTNSLPGETANGTLTTLHAFHQTDGNRPVALVRASSGMLYGATKGGGTADQGEVFALSPEGAFTTLHVFQGSDGSAPAALVLDADNNLYGITSDGGVGRDGTLFEISASGDFRTLASFIGTNGACPDALVLGNDGNLYGTTALGGPAFTSNVDVSVEGYGTLFRVTPGGELTTLWAFSGIDGYQPADLLQTADGTLIGISSGGGPTFQNTSQFGGGTVFSLSPSGILTTLYGLDNFTASQPTSLARAGNGDLYVSTYGGGQNGNGVVLQITPAGAVTLLFEFSGNDGTSPANLAIGTDGNLYGTTYQGGPNYQFGGDAANDAGQGTVFQLTPAGVLTTLYAFNGPDGATPDALLLSSAGTLDGATGQGGSGAGMPSVGGTVFQLSGIQLSGTAR